jgi:hypothetical protein
MILLKSKKKIFKSNINIYFLYMLLFNITFYYLKYKNNHFNFFFLIKKSFLNINLMIKNVYLKN